MSSPAVASAEFDGGRHAVVVVRRLRTRPVAGDDGHQVGDGDPRPVDLLDQSQVPDQGPDVGQRVDSEEGGRLVPCRGRPAGGPVEGDHPVEPADVLPAQGGEPLDRQQLGGLGLGRSDQRGRHRRPWSAGTVAAGPGTVRSAASSSAGRIRRCRRSSSTGPTRSRAAVASIDSRSVSQADLGQGDDQGVDAASSARSPPKRPMARSSWSIGPGTWRRSRISTSSRRSSARRSGGAPRRRRRRCRATAPVRPRSIG